MGVLPGRPEERFYRVTGGLMMNLAPLATILFALLLPVAYVASFATPWGYKLINLQLGLGHAHPKGAG